MGIVKDKRTGLYSIKKTIDGKVYWKSLKTKNFKEAKVRAKTIEKIIIRNHYQKILKPSKKSFKEIAKAFIEDKKRRQRSPLTIKTYERVIKCKLNNNLNGNEQTQRLYRRHLSVIYNWAIKKGLLDSNPYNDSPKQTIPKISYYTQKEVEKILDGLGNRKIDKMIKVLFYTGLRRGEAGHLKEEDVLDDLIIVYGKTGRRTIPIPKEIKPIFDDLEIYTFNPESLGLALQKRGLSATKIRHTFATRLVRNGMDLYRIAKLMGHASVKTTEKFYAHLKPIDIKNHSDFLKL